MFQLIYTFVRLSLILPFTFSHYTVRTESLHSFHYIINKDESGISFFGNFCTYSLFFYCRVRWKCFTIGISEMNCTEWKNSRNKCRFSCISSDAKMSHILILLFPLRTHKDYEGFQHSLCSDFENTLLGIYATAP